MSIPTCDMFEQQHHQGSSPMILQSATAPLVHLLEDSQQLGVCDIPLNLSIIPPRPALHAAPLEMINLDIAPAVKDPEQKYETSVTAVVPAMVNNYQLDEVQSKEKVSSAPTYIIGWLLLLSALLSAGSVGPLLTVYPDALRSRAFFVGGWHLMMGSVVFIAVCCVSIGRQGLSDNHKELLKSPKQWPALFSVGFFYGIGFGFNALAVTHCPNFTMVNIIFGLQPFFVLICDACT
eukprot:NODE_1384_length_1560_cov_15.769027_g1246_i0.p1 GENE.NODE_1384_length_1560_cov_15.769027_g1246_i0~~NODE_1384_length_1560_cov_15.769027_g1246_i0.p1  ORF type:complete len:235 (+),score=33.48 NODE_1384_length_1560_cov_15.769027_g1246_i0:78-782(+)